MTASMLPFLVAGIALVAVLRFFGSGDRDGEWHRHSTFRRGSVMRRWCAGEWQYREPTVEEENQRAIDYSV